MFLKLGDTEIPIFKNKRLNNTKYTTYGGHAYNIYNSMDQEFSNS